LRMRNLITIFLTVVLAQFLLANDALASKREFREHGEKLREGLAQGATDLGDRIEECKVGIEYALDQVTVISVGRVGYDIGVREHDVLLEVEGVKIDPDDPDLSEKIPKRHKGDQISFRVRRGTQEIELSGECPYSWGDFNLAWKSVVPTLLKDDPEECLSALSNIESQFGVSHASYSNRNTCYYRYLEKTRRLNNSMSDYASLVLAQYLFQIESASYKDGALEDLKPEILRILAWLDNAQQRRFSRELERSYEEALSSAREQEDHREVVAGTLSTGTCSAISDDGLLLTSEHVVSGGGQISIRFEGENAIPATIESTSPNTDLAVLRVSRKTEDFIGLAPMRSVQPGDEIFTYGYPASAVLGREPKFTDGTVSALSGPGGEAAFLQISVPIQPGNSGGPVVNNEGQLVGVVAATAAIEPFFRNTGSLPQNVNWAVKADYARLMFDMVERPAEASRGSAIELVRNSICFVEVQY